jgi:hypothetical protein
MTYADRVKDTTTTTGTGPITVSGTPPTGFQAISAVGPVGSTFTYAIASQTANEWEIGTATITAANVFSRVVASSSNANALVNFSVGTKDVFCTVSSRSLTSGLSDPADVGFDIILLAGQSNMAGRGTYDALVDLAAERVMQFGGYNGDARYRTIFSGADPLHMNEAVETNLVGPGTHAARAYCAGRNLNRRVLLVPTAVGGTTMVALTPGWGPGSPGGSLYENAIAQANLAIAAALSLYPNSRFVGTFWHQGESDGDNNVSQAAYVTACKALITGFRTRITGAANSWFVIGGMTPEGIAGAGGTRAAINAAHIQVASEVDRCAFAAGPSGMGDTNHYTAPGIRILGARMGVAVESARYYAATDVTPPAQVSAAVANSTPAVVNITMTEAIDPAYVPAASAFTVGGHTVSSVAIAANILSLTCSAAFVNGEAARTVAYTQPGSNNVRDLSGNLLASFSGLAITNNVAAVASAVTLAGPASGVVSTASAAFGVGVSPVGGAISGTVVVTPSDGGGGGTFNPTSVNLTTASPTATFTYTPSATPGARTISATNNGGLANPANLTYTSTAAATVPGAPTIGAATGGNASVSVAFTAPSSNGGAAITSYTASLYKVSDNSLVASASGPTSPINVTGATNGIAVYAKVAATNSVNTGAQSAASGSVTPAAAVAFATWNPADKDGSITLTGGNLVMNGTNGGAFMNARSTLGKSTGKWYWENTVGGPVEWMIGVGTSAAGLTNAFVGSDAFGWGMYTTGPSSYHSGTSANYGSGMAAGDVIGVALDMTAGTLTFYKNGVSQGVAFTGISGTVFAMSSVRQVGATIAANFGATAFAYTPPAGFVGLS